MALSTTGIFNVRPDEQLKCKKRKEISQLLGTQTLVRVTTNCHSCAITFNQTVEVAMKLMDHLHDAGVEAKRTTARSGEISQIGVADFSEKYFQVSLVLPFKGELS